MQELENSLMKLKENQKELNFYLKEEQAKVAHLECELAAFTEVGQSSEPINLCHHHKMIIDQEG